MLDARDMSEGEAQRGGRCAGVPVVLLWRDDEVQRPFVLARAVGAGFGSCELTVAWVRFLNDMAAEMLG